MHRSNILNSSVLISVPPTASFRAIISSLLNHLMISILFSLPKSTWLIFSTSFTAFFQNNTSTTHLASSFCQYLDSGSSLCSFTISSISSSDFKENTFNNLSTSESSEFKKN